MKIDLRRVEGSISHLSLPYTVKAIKPFELANRVSDETYDPTNGRVSGKEKFVSSDYQIKAFETAVKSLVQGDRHSRGWTACFSCVSSIETPEYVAAFLIGQAASRGMTVQWVDVARAFKSNIYSVDDLSSELPVAVVFTGLRLEDNQTRYTRIFDLVRSTSSYTSRIIVGCGGTPLALSARLGLSVQRTLNLEARDGAAIYS